MNKGVQRASDLLSNILVIRWMHAWQEAAGPIVGKQARFLGLQRRDGALTLCLEVTDPAWRQELEYEKNSLLERFNAALTRSGASPRQLPTNCHLNSSFTGRRATRRE